MSHIAKLCGCPKFNSDFNYMNCITKTYDIKKNILYNERNTEKLFYFSKWMYATCNTNIFTIFLNLRDGIFPAIFINAWCFKYIYIFESCFSSN